jgi:hypothetical protein
VGGWQLAVCSRRFAVGGLQWAVQPGTKLDELEKEAKDAAKEKLGEVVGDKIDSTALKKAQEIIDKNKEAERIKKELEKFNPLKKKKEGGGR